MSLIKPKSEDYIVEAIREIRAKPVNMESGTAAGVVIYRVWDVVSEIYTEQEFRQGLELLLMQKTLVAVWRICHVKINRNYGPHRDEFITSIPENAPLGRDRWYRDMSGQTLEITEVESVEYDLIASIKLFVLADGLPKNYSKRKNTQHGTKAQQILDRLQKDT